MKVRVSKRAQAQIERAAQWWDQHRDLAPQAFDEDLAKAFLLLGTEPLIGAPFASISASGVRRLHRLENDARFLRRIAAARESIRRGEGVAIEKVDFESP